MRVQQLAAWCGVTAIVAGTVLACGADPPPPVPVERTFTTTETATVTETETKIDYPNFPSALIPTETETVTITPPPFAQG
jgi:hypothetical protein